MKYKYLLMAAFVLPCAMFTACGGGDDDETGKTDVTKPEPPITSDTILVKTIDNNYSASLSEIQKSWAGEYEGWDENQQKNTKIRRLLVLEPNNQYVNVVQGVLIESGKTDYVDFEHERGSYSYNARTNTLTYTVSSDSVLDYRNQKLDGYKGKKYYDRTEGNYTEKVQFSEIHNGERKWITRDTYLQSLTVKTIKIAFEMDAQKPNDQQRK